MIFHLVLFQRTGVLCNGPDKWRTPHKNLAGFKECVEVRVLKLHLSQFATPHQHRRFCLLRERECLCVCLCVCLRERKREVWVWVRSEKQWGNLPLASKLSHVVTIQRTKTISKLLRYLIGSQFLHFGFL